MPTDVILSSVVAAAVDLARRGHGWEDLHVRTNLPPLRCKLIVATYGGAKSRPGFSRILSGADD